MHIRPRILGAAGSDGENPWLFGELKSVGHMTQCLLQINKHTKILNIKSMALSIHSAFSMHLLCARPLGKWPTSHSSLLKTRLYFVSVHIQTRSTWMTLTFPLLFQERQTKRKMNELRCAMDVKQEHLGGSRRTLRGPCCECGFLIRGSSGGRHRQAVAKLSAAISLVCSESLQLMGALSRASTQLLVHSSNPYFLNAYCVLVLF